MVTSVVTSDINVVLMAHADIQSRPQGSFVTLTVDSGANRTFVQGARWFQDGTYEAESSDVLGF